MLLMNFFTLFYITSISLILLEYWWSFHFILFSLFIPDSYNLGYFSSDWLDLLFCDWGLGIDIFYYFYVLFSYFFYVYFFTSFAFYSFFILNGELSSIIMFKLSLLSLFYWILLLLNCWYSFKYFFISFPLFFSYSLYISNLSSTNSCE